MLSDRPVVALLPLPGSRFRIGAGPSPYRPNATSRALMVKPLGTSTRLPALNSTTMSSRSNFAARAIDRTGSSGSNPLLPSFPSGAT